jgi:hypothetical protein
MPGACQQLRLGVFMPTHQKKRSMRTLAAAGRQASRPGDAWPTAGSRVNRPTAHKRQKRFSFDEKYGYHEAWTLQSNDEISPADTSHQSVQNPQPFRLRVF